MREIEQGKVIALEVVHAGSDDTVTLLCHDDGSVTWLGADTARGKVVPIENAWAATNGSEHTNSDEGKA